MSIEDLCSLWLSLHVNSAPTMKSGVFALFHRPMRWYDIILESKLLETQTCNIVIYTRNSQNTLCHFLALAQVEILDNEFRWAWWKIISFKISIFAVFFHQPKWHPSKMSKLWKKQALICNSIALKQITSIFIILFNGNRENRVKRWVRI